MIGIAMLVVSALFLLSLIREVWVILMRPDRFDSLVKPKFRYGEDGDQEVSRNDKFFVSYPLFILAPGIIGWLLITTSF